MERLSVSRKYQVTLGENSPRNSIVIASPVWYTKRKTVYPVNIAHIAIAVMRSNSNSNTGDEPFIFEVEVGENTVAAGDKFSGHPNVGMNFTALDPALDNDDIVSSFVDVDTTGTVINNLATNKYTAEGSFTSGTATAFNVTSTSTSTATTIKQKCHIRICTMTMMTGEEENKGE